MSQTRHSKVAVKTVIKRAIAVVKERRAALITAAKTKKLYVSRVA